MFNWQRFFTAHNIEWVDKGPSATKGNIAIRCPRCGMADPSHHLAVSLEGKGYRCFRTKSHSGRSVPKLIQDLLQCSWPEALRLAGVATHVSSDFVADHEVGKKLFAYINKTDTTTEPKTLRFPAEFRALADRGGGRYFVDYLLGRGYDLDDIPELREAYNLQYAIAGAFKYRLVFPITMNNKLVNWTGRSISSTATLRYRTLSTDPETAREDGLPAATRSIEQTLFNYDNLLEGGDELLICEGPFDAMRLDLVGGRTGIHATCVFTKDVSTEQIFLLEKLRDLYDRITLVIDNDAQLDVLALQRRLAHLDCGTRHIPKRYKDPAEMSIDAVEKWL